MEGPIDEASEREGRADKPQRDDEHCQAGNGPGVKIGKIYPFLLIGHNHLLLQFKLP